MTVLIIGFGSIARKHKYALDSIVKEINWYALRSSKDYKDIPGVTSITSTDELPGIDFSIICNPNSKHLDALELIKDLSCPILIEKPVFHKKTFKGLNILKELEDKSIPVAVGFNMRFHPAILFLKEKIDTSEILEVNCYCGSFLPDWRPGQDYTKSYSSNKSLGGGVHLDLIHELDYMVNLFGFPETNFLYKTRKSKLEIDVPDCAHHILDYPNFNVFITLNYYRKKPKREFEIIFKDKIWTVDLLNCLVTDENDEVIFSSNFDISLTYKEQMKEFLKFCLRKESSILSTGLESYELMRLLE